MLINEPASLRVALSPIIYFNWLIGMGLFHPLHSKTIHFLMVMYSVVFWILYVLQFYIGISAMVPSYFYDNSPLAIIMYQILVYTNSCVSLLAPFLLWKRHKSFNSYVDKLQKLDDIFERILGFEKNYKKIVSDQIFAMIGVSSLMLVITIADSLWLQSDTTFFIKISIMFTFHYPMLLMIATDSTFCGSARILGRMFKNLNTTLLRLSEEDDAPYPRGRLIVVEQKFTNLTSLQRISGTRNSLHKRYLFQTIRRTHLELCKLAGTLNSSFGIQNLISMTVSSVMITGLLYTIYTAFHWEHTMHERIREVMPPAGWCVIYIFKIFMVSHTSASVNDEAHKSGQIIYEIFESAGDKEFEKEIQEFALQIIQNPVQFTACGFFTLDHSYIRGVIGSITTYLVILIQMSSTSVSPQSSMNRTETGTQNLSTN